MPRWGLIVEQNQGYGRGQLWAVEVLDHVDGTRQEALDALRARAERFEPHHPANPERRMLYQEAEGFLLVVKGFWRSFHCRFRIAEQLSDSHPPEPPADASPEPVPEPRQEAREPHRPAAARRPPRHAPEPEPGPPPAWDADVPQVPSWLGRDDLS